MEARKEGGKMETYNDSLPDEVLSDLYEQAQDEVLGANTFDQPCRHGHFDCSQVSGGACSEEAVAERFGDLTHEWKREEGGYVSTHLVVFLSLIPLTVTIVIFTARMIGTLEAARLAGG